MSTETPFYRQSVVSESPSMVDACARAAHEANRAYCIALGDTSQPSWDDAPAWQQSSCLLGVVGTLRGSTPEQAHESWVIGKQRAGWHYGPAKDTGKKEHPCMVPYRELPPEQRAKDDLFAAVVRAVADAFDAASKVPL